MSFYVSFFASSVQSARGKLREAYAPEGVKALIELAIASVPQERAVTGAGQASASAASTNIASSANRATPAPKGLAGIRVETSGHIDEYGGRSYIDRLTVEPFYHD